MAENVADDHGLVVQFITGEGDRTRFGHRPELAEQRGLMRELLLVSAPELSPSSRIMAEPSTQLGTRRQILEPAVDARFRFGQTARPKSINEHTHAVLGVTAAGKRA
jgi:hypothetical protein